MLRMIDALDEERYRGMTHAAYRLAVRLIREADRAGDMGAALSVPQSTIAEWLDCTPRGTMRPRVELRAFGIASVTAGTPKRKGYSGQAATYTLRVDDILAQGTHVPRYADQPGTPVPGYEAEPGTSVPPTVPSRSSRPDDDARTDDPHIQFLNRLHQHLASPEVGGPSWGFRIDADLMAEVKRCIAAGMTEDDITTHCEDATKSATRAVRSWSYYVRALDTERRDRTRPAPVARQRPHNDRGMLNQHSDHVAEAAMAKAMRERARARQGTSA